MSLYECASATMSRASLYAVVLLCTAYYVSPQLLTTSNTTADITNTTCSPPSDSSDDFPGDIFSQEQRLHGAFLVHGCVALYFFILIAFVCNDFFLPSVDCICQDLSLSQDVAGATFMALATCTPELFTNLIGTFITDSDLGVGTVVGSAVFNTLGVPACGGLTASICLQVISLQVYPLARDCGIYMTVIGVLAVILWDEKIFWYEATVLLVLYLVYCVIMFCDSRMTKAAKKILKKANSFDSTRSIRSVKSDVSTGAGDGVYKPFHHHGEQLSSIERARSPSLREPKDTQAHSIEEADNKEKTSLCVRPEGLWSGCWWGFTLPVEIVLYLTVPNCRKRRRLYPFTFLMCIVWIGISSYIISWMVTIVGNTFGISDSVMGITFLAIGGSMPEASSSVINARLGIGSMSISNALGANTLDILLCLGLPWMIKTLLPASMGGGPITIQSTGLVYNTAAQIACVAILFTTAALNRFSYNKVLGSVCLVMYLTFIGFIVVVETNLFGWTHGDLACG